MILPKLTRQRIYTAKGAVAITWPQDAPEPQVGHKYSIQSSATKSGEHKFSVEARTELPDGWMATVRLDGDPVRLLGKQAGYVTSGQGAIGTRRGPEPDAMGGPVFRAEVEPEAVDSRYQRRLSEEKAMDNAKRQEKGRQREKLLEKEQEAADSRPNRAQRSHRRQSERLKRLLADAA